MTFDGGGSVNINIGASYTNSTTVTLTISSSDEVSGVSQMMVSESSSFAGASWETYATSKSFALSSGEGTKTVYVKFKDAAGNESSAVSDSIILQLFATGKRVALFANTSYVDYITGAFSAEASNLKATIDDLGHVVDTFTGISATAINTALVDKDVLAIPELEKAGLGLDADAETAISDFVSGGGTLMIFADYLSRYLTLLNSIFGFSMSRTSTSGAVSLNTSDASGTPFEGGPSSMPTYSATYAVSGSTLPSDSKEIYIDSFSNSVLTVISYGEGSIEIFGWDWFDASPTGSQDGGWIDVLDRALTLIEGFESGDFDELTWSTGGDDSWQTASDFAYNGSYAAKAPVSISDSESSYLEITLVAHSTGNVSFWFKVSSEEDYDFLRFKIDGIQKIAWSGELGWAQATFSFSAGTRTFRWEYTKDIIVSSGSDTAWIDDIFFH
jgi:hypothetical protein